MVSSTITYAGHSAVFAELGSLRCAIDPWLENNPLCPAALKTPSQLDLIVLTHAHSDHASDAARLAKHCGAHIAATWELAMIMIDEGVPQNLVIPMNKGGTVQHKNLKITLTHALHSSSYDTAGGPRYGGEACGVVLRDASNVIYHAGDTALFSDMSLIGKLYKPQVALLPVGDRFTMGPGEAAQAAKLVGCSAAIPIHHSTFDLLTGTPEAFREECEKLGLQCVILAPGQSYTINSQ